MHLKAMEMETEMTEMEINYSSEPKQNHLLMELFAHGRVVRLKTAVSQSVRHLNVSHAERKHAVPQFLLQRFRFFLTGLHVWLVHSRLIFITVWTRARERPPR